MSQAFAPATRAHQSSAATYGDLIASTRERLDLALVEVSTRRSADVVTANLLGYERFLRVAGAHLAMLSQLSGATNTGLERLVRKLSRLSHRETPAGPWATAASTLGAAHDLVATHLSSYGARTHEVAELIAGPASLAACVDVVRLVVDAELGAQATLDRLSWERRSLHGDATFSLTVNRVRAVHLGIDTASKAALWDLEHTIGPSAIAKLDGVRPAPTPLALAPDAVTLDQRLDALRLVRQLTRLQAAGRAAASPASLRDLANLGAYATNPALPLPEPRSGLERVRTAHARDQLDVAHAAWEAAGAELTSTIRGLSKAPNEFRVAIASVTHDTEPRYALRIAIAEVLPRLAADATATVGALTAEGALVTSQPIYAQPRRSWKPIDAADGAHLAGRFRAAGDASAAVASALQVLAPRSPRTTPEPPVAHAGQHLSPTRGGITR